jgi:hypothetical protein
MNRGAAAIRLQPPFCFPPRTETRELGIGYFGDWGSRQPRDHSQKPTTDLHCRLSTVCCRLSASFASSLPPSPWSLFSFHRSPVTDHSSLLRSSLSLHPRPRSLYSLPPVTGH